MKTGLDITAQLLNILHKIKQTNALARSFAVTWDEQQILEKVEYDHKNEDGFLRLKLQYFRREFSLARVHDLDLPPHYEELAKILNHFESVLPPSLALGPPSVSFWQEITTHQEQVARVIQLILDNPQQEQLTPLRYQPEPARVPWYLVLEDRLKELAADIDRGFRYYRILSAIPAEILLEEQKQKPWIRPLPPTWLLEDFNRRTFRQRTELIWENGHFLLGRREGPFRIELYWVRRFFAEIWYREAEQSLELVHGFKSGNCLQPYLESTNLLTYPEGFRMKGTEKGLIG